MLQFERVVGLCLGLPAEQELRLHNLNKTSLVCAVHAIEIQVKQKLAVDIETALDDERAQE